MGDNKPDFSADIPSKIIGILFPLPIIDYSAYEFYRMAPPGIMLSMISVALTEFSSDAVEKVFAPIDKMVDELMVRDLDLIMQGGVPLEILLGLDGHDRLMLRMEERSGVPATSSILGIISAAKRLGIRSIALANKWSDPMNAVLSEFFRRDGIEVAGFSNKDLAPADFQRLAGNQSIDLAYSLGKTALETFPKADALYLGGGAWISQPAAEHLEAEFGRPVICNQNAMLWDVMDRLGIWKPIHGHGRLLSLD
jgi:maleate cis-trans isomerase